MVKLSRLVRIMVKVGSFILQMIGSAHISDDIILLFGGNER